MALAHDAGSHDWQSIPSWGRALSSQNHLSRRVFGGQAGFGLMHPHAKLSLPPASVNDSPVTQFVVLSRPSAEHEKVTFNGFRAAGVPHVAIH